MDVIELITKNLSSSINKYQNASIAVPGGTSPIKIFNELSKQKLDWSKVQITLVDDRLVDPDNDHSNQKLINDYLLKNDAKKSKFFPLNKNLIKNDNFKFPLDICLLGIGNDGHFASLFPNMINNTNMLDPKSKSSIDEVKANGNPFIPRISMNLPLILSSNLIILLIKGKLKQEVLREAYNNKNIPLYYLLKHRINNFHIELLND
jgi:6-phosphogluconolactonase